MRRRSGPRRSERDIDLAIALPPETGHWRVKLDLVRGDRHLSRDGIVQPQLRIPTESPWTRAATRSPGATGWYCPGGRWWDCRLMSIAPDRTSSSAADPDRTSTGPFP